MREQINKAIRLFEKGNVEEAEKIFDEIDVQKIDDLESLMQYGQLAIQLEQYIVADYCFSRAKELQPENADVYSFLAAVHYKLQRIQSATELSEKAIELNPKLPVVHALRARIANDKGDFVLSARLYEKSVELKPSVTNTYIDLVHVLTKIGRHEDALKYAKKLLRLESSARHHLPISGVLAGMGRMDEAISYLEQALAMDDSNGLIYLVLVRTKKFSPEDKEFIQRVEKTLLRREMSTRNRSLMHFSLGKMYDDLKEWDKAFENYKQANLLGKSGIRPTVLSERFKKAKNIYTKSRIGHKDLYGSESDIPIFVVGMPRSGTTLIEQLIASHPDAEGAGELTYVTTLHNKIVMEGDISKKAISEKLNKENLAQYADEYLQVLCQSRKGAIHIVDKMPDNFLVLGLIHMLFPNAKIIHAMRNPLDSCLSCYFQPFEYLPETYDVEWLAARYRLYEQAMAYWRTVLPEGVIFDINYEDLVDDFENHSRRILEFCGLPWDDRCLEFNKNSRAISTASVWQVRQPIYKSSRKRWVNYASHLGVLAQEINEYLNVDDVAELEKHGVKVKKKKMFGFL